MHMLSAREACSATAVPDAPENSRNKCGCSGKSEIHVLKQKCVNDWRDVVEQLFRMSSFPDGKDEVLSTCRLICRHKKLRLPIQLKDALMGKRKHSAVFDDDSDSNTRYECLKKSEFKLAIV